VVPQLSRVLRDEERDEDVIGVICAACGPVVVSLTSSASLCGNVGKPTTFICLSISLYRFQKVCAQEMVLKRVAFMALILQRF
jgi:hypothetical protein